MKKTLTILTSLVGSVAVLTACSNPTTPASVAKNIENNVNTLTNCVTKLDTIDNNYLINPDLYGNTENILSNMNLTANNNNYVATPVIKGNTTNEVNNKNTSKNLNNNVNNNNESINNNNENSSNYTNTMNTSTRKTGTLKSNKNYNFNRSNYSPRYTTNTNMFNSDESFNNYMGKVQKLYTISNDAIEANNFLSNCKDKLLECSNEVKKLSTEMKDGTFKPSPQQLQALTNYINDLKYTINNLKGINGKLNEEVNNINNSTGNT